MFFFPSPNSFCALLATALLLNAAGVRSADAQVTTGQRQDAALAEIQVRSHADASVGHSDAASAATVDGQVFADIALLRPGQALETVPGLVVTQHSGEGKANQYFLRGYNLDHGTDFAISVDGMPANMPTHAHGQGYADLNHLIPELIQTIDYRKGPYFVANGDFASAGSADIHYVSALERGLFQVTTGSFGYRRILVAASTRLGSGREGFAPSPEPDGPTLLGAIESVAQDGPWSTAEGLARTNAVMRLSDGSQARGWSLSGNAYQSRWNATDQVPLSMLQTGQLGTYGTLDPSDGGEASRASLAAEWHDVDASGYRRVSGYVQRSHLQLWSDFTYFAYRNPALGCSQIANNVGIGSFNLPGFAPGDCPLAPTAGAPTDQFSQFENRNTMGGGWVRGWNHAWAGRPSVTEVGLQVRHDDIDVGLQDTQQRVAFYTVSRDQVRQTALGLTLQNATAWTPWLRTLAGARLDELEMRVDSRVIAQNSGGASQSLISPKVSVVFGPWNRTEIFINAGSGLHSNDARGVVARIDASTGAAATPVPALVASFGRELGVRSEPWPGYQTSLALWSLDSASELVYSADSGSTEPRGASRRYGVEWSNHWIYRHWLLVDADMAWTHARYAAMDDNGSTGNMIANAVSQVAILRATALGLGAWSVGWETRFIGAYPLSQDGTLVAPSSTVSSFRVRRALSRDAEIGVDVLNVFDALYYDIAYQQDYQTSANGAYVASGQTVHPGEPRQVRVTLRVKF